MPTLDPLAPLARGAAASLADPASAGLTLEQVWALARRHSLYAGMGLDVAGAGDVPVLEKPALYEALTRWLRVPAHLRGLYLSPTGGSSAGGRLHFPVAIEDNRLQRRWLARALVAAGVISPADVALNLFSGRMMYRALEIFNDFCEQAGATVLPVECTTPDAPTVEIARTFGADLIMGEPARLMHLARWLQEHEQRLPMKRVLYGGDSLRAAPRALVVSAFETEAVLSIFGSAETGIWGYATERDEIDVFHFDPRMIHLEIVAPDEDGTGLMVITSLARRHVPLLRYRTGDRARWVARGPDRSSFQIMGREAGSFVINGDYFSLAEVQPVFERMLDYQLHLSYDEGARRDALEVRLVPPAGWTEADQEGLAVELSRVLGSRGGGFFVLRFRLVSHDELERAPTSRKVRRIVDVRRA
jgi:phenylacetate-CoA ligase